MQQLEEGACRVQVLLCTVKSRWFMHTCHWRLASNIDRDNVIVAVVLHVDWQYVDLNLLIWLVALEQALQEVPAPRWKLGTKGGVVERQQRIVCDFHTFEHTYLGGSDLVDVGH